MNESIKTSEPESDEELKESVQNSAEQNAETAETGELKTDVQPQENKEADDEANETIIEDEGMDVIPETRPIGLNYYAVEDPVQTAPIVPEQITPAIIGIGRVEPTKEPTLHASVRCDVGARERNEDSCITFTAESGGHFKMMPFGLYIVADGMGGHTNGHVASRIASRTAASHIFNKIYMALLQSVGPPTHVPIQEVLVDAVQAANTAVYTDDLEVDSGTTLTIALVLGRRLHVAHVGDSRLYLLNEDKLEPITVDHSLVQRLQDVGQLTAEEAVGYRYKHVLLRAVGQVEEVEVDTYMRLLPKKGKLLLCSDGLCGFVEENVMADIMKEDVSTIQIANNLYDAALEARSNDNVTAVVVDLDL